MLRRRVLVAGMSDPLPSIVRCESSRSVVERVAARLYSKRCRNNVELHVDVADMRVILKLARQGLRAKDKQRAIRTVVSLEPRPRAMHDGHGNSAIVGDTYEDDPT